MSPVLSKQRASAGVPNTCSVRPPVAGLYKARSWQDWGKSALPAGSVWRRRKAMYLPSGVNAEGISPAELVVRRCAAPPSDGITNTSKFPCLSLAKRYLFAVRRPYGRRFVRLLRGELCGRTAFCGNFVDVSPCNRKRFPCRRVKSVCRASREELRHRW